MGIRLPLHGNTGPLGEFNGVQAQGVEGAGVYWLLLRLGLKLRDDIVGTGVMKVKQFSGLIRMNSAPLSASYFDGSKIERWHSYTDTIPYLMFPLSPAQIESIEVCRNGGDIQLGLKLSGEYILDDEDPGTFTSDGDIRISQQDWVDVLSHMGYKNSLFFEIGIPNGDDGASIRESVRSAQSFLLRGDYKSCVGTCREVIELYFSDVRWDSLKKGMPPSPKDRNVAQRILAVWDAIREVTHLPHHVGLDEYSREQAVQILGLTVIMASALAPRELR